RQRRGRGGEEVRTSRDRLAVPAALALAAAPTLFAQTAAIPDDPEKLVFKPIVYTPRAAKDYRVVLHNGMVVYIAEDPAPPLVNVDLTIGTGTYPAPARQ